MQLLSGIFLSEQNDMVVWEQASNNAYSTKSLHGNIVEFIDSFKGCACRSNYRKDRALGMALIIYFCVFNRMLCVVCCA